MLKRQQVNMIREGWATGILTKYKDKFKEFFTKLKHQFQYNARAKAILSSYISTGSISKTDAAELKIMSTDLLKMVGLGSIAMMPIPGGMLLMLFLINSAKHLGIDLIPSHFESADNSGHIDLQTYDLKKLFDRINTECFSGKLTIIPIIVKPIKSVTAKYNASINPTGIPHMTKDDRITISNLTQFTDDKLKNILCHEMIHYWVNSRYNPREHHGEHFISNMNRVNRLGYNVSLTDDQPGEVNQEISTTEHIMITGDYADNWKFYVVMPASSIRKMDSTELLKLLQVYVTTPKFQEVSYYITTAPEVKQLKGSRDISKYSVMKVAYNYLLDNVKNSSKTRGTTIQEITAMAKQNITEAVHAGVDYDIRVEDEDEDGDRTVVTLYTPGRTQRHLIGKLVFERVFTGLDLMGIIDEEEYDRIFPDDSYIKIEHIKVEPFYARKGFGKILMTEALKEIDKTRFDRIYLNASPMGTHIPLRNLIDFYESFGFKVFHKEANNAEMYKEI